MGTGMISEMIMTGSVVLLSGVGFLISARIFAEGVIAYRTTRRRQRLMHPDPVAEQEVVEELILRGCERARREVVVDAVEVV